MNKLGKSYWSRRTARLTALTCAVIVVGAGAAFATSTAVRVRGGGGSGAVLDCPRGMARLGHVFSENASVFPGDPSPEISDATTIAANGFLVEEVKTGTHTGTHIDAPAHFIEGGRSIDQLSAAEFVWPVYVIDVRARMAASADDGFQLSVADVRQYERDNGRIATGSMVVIRTGFDLFFGTPAFLDATPGFAGATVQWLVDERRIGGIGSDTFGPDATSDADFSATYTILSNNRVALPGLNNLASLQVKGDIILAPTVALRRGSGYQTDPLGCLGRLTPRNQREDD